MPSPQDYRKTAQTHRKGIRAVQPAANTVLPGTLYYVTDDGFIERSDGTTWTSYIGTLPMSKGGTGSSSFTTGSVIFSDGTKLTEDNANLFWDSINKRLGIGTAIPDRTLTLLSEESIIRVASLGVSNNDHAAVILENQGVGTANNSQVRYTNTNSATAVWTTGLSTSNSYAYQLANSTNLNVNVRLTILTGGNVGIGQTSPTATLHIKAGTTAASSAPLKLTSGTSMTTAEAGAIEFTTDDFFATITTGAARKAFVLDDGARLTSGKIPRATTNGRLIDGPTPLSGTKIYFVADTSGGVVTRKLTFVDGILTAET